MTLLKFLVLFTNSVPKNYARVDLAADKYREISIKLEETENRNASSKMQIGTTKSKTPEDIGKF